MNGQMTHGTGRAFEGKAMGLPGAVLCALVAACAAVAGGPPEATRSPANAPAQAAERVAPPAVVCERATYHRVSDQDAGTVRLFARNDTAGPISLASVAIDGRPLGDRALPTAPVIWHGLFPKSIGAGRRGELVIKLRRRPHGLLRVSARFAGGAPPIEAPIVPRNASLRIVSVGFRADLTGAYVYVVNGGTSRLALTAVDHDAEGIPLKSTATDIAVDAGATACVTLSFNTPLVMGQYLGLRAVPDQGAPAHAVVRVSTGFPVSFEMGQTAFLRDTWSTEDIALLTRAPGVFWCPAHAHGPWEESAAKILEAGSDVGPAGPVLHMCRRDLRTAWPIFAHTADLCRTNTSLRDDALVKRLGAARSIVWLTDLTRSCAAPRPFHAMVSVSNWWGEVWSLERFPAPEEVAIGVYLSLAGGARGLCYRNRGWSSANPPPQKLVKGLAQITREIAPLGPALAVGCPVPWVASRDKRVLAGAVLSGRRTLVVFAVNTAYTTHPSAKVEEPFRVEPVPDVVLKLALPPGIALGTPSYIAPDGCAVEVNHTREGEIVALPSLRLAFAAVCPLVAVDAVPAAEHPETGKEGVAVDAPATQAPAVNQEGGRP